jgi:hypothetical protein
MDEITPIPYRCAFCGQENETFVDPTEGQKQSYTEDCSVCCRPNKLMIFISYTGEISVVAEFDE